MFDGCCDEDMLDGTRGDQPSLSDLHLDRDLTCQPSPVVSANIMSFVHYQSDPRTLQGGRCTDLE